jgi:transcription initiation factor TFIID TATA-box-binding protein
MPNELKINNITATANLGAKLDLRLLATRVWNVEYNPRKFNALILRTRKPRVTALIFHTGKIVVVGATCVRESEEGAAKVAKLISGKTSQLADFSLQNIAASSHVNYRVNLEELSECKRGFVVFEPELFTPAAKMRYKKDKNLIALIFRSGKLIYTGTIEFSDIVDFHDYLSRMLLKFQQRIY